MPTAAPSDTPTLPPEPTAPATSAVSPSASAGPVSWTTTATQYRDMDGQQFEYDCPPDGVADTIWGTDVYTDDSSVCTAAVHVGLITLADGGSVTIEMRPGRDSYEPSTRNGIESQSWGPWSSSFVLVEP